jgi:UDP-glucose 4-epimerase
MNGDNVIIFGGSGFLGSHVADALSENGYKVKIFDLAESPYIRPDQEMIIGSITDLDAVCRATEGCKYVMNFAGIADIGDANLNPPVTAQINVVGAVNTLEAARMAGTERYLFASTVYVYTRYGAMYKASKQAAECFIETYQQEHGLDYTVLRYGTLYGRRSDGRNRIYNFLKAAYETGTIEYEGSIDAIREFIHVTDAASLTLRALGLEYKNRHLILTGQEKMTIGELLSVISELMPGDIKWTCAEVDSTKHYMITPYSFQPRLGHKMVPEDFVDLGQGLLDCLNELLEKEKGNTELIPPPTNAG